MRQSPYERQEVRLSFGGGFPPALRVILGVNVGVYLLDVLLGLGASGPARHAAWQDQFALIPWEVIHHGRLWQLLSYSFLHAGLGHLFFNLLALWMFSGDIERAMGSRRFAAFYLLCALGAGVTTALLRWNSPHPTVGASGAVYGVLLAYGLLFPDRVIYLYFLVPLRARVVVALFALMELLMSVAATRDGIAHLTHLGGMLTAWLWLRGTGPGGLWMRWRRHRVRRKLKVIDTRKLRRFDPPPRGRGSGTRGR
jgi:membrane associated rhomboid family serine protease